VHPVADLKPAVPCIDTLRRRVAFPHNREKREGGLERKKCWRERMKKGTKLS
jgi:hypothetical protein